MPVLRLSLLRLLEKSERFKKNLEENVQNVRNENLFINTENLENLSPVIAIQNVILLKIKRMRGLKNSRKCMKESLVRLVELL
jgi:hypothetical protein